MIVNTSFLLKPLTGAQRFAWELTKRLIENKFIKILYIPNLIHENYKKDFFEDLGDISGLTIKRISVQNYFLFENILAFISKINKKKLLNFTNTIPFIGASFLFTIHDLIPLKYPSSKVSYLYFKYYLKYFIKKTNFLVTVSNFSAQEICKYYNFEEGKIKIIYNAWDHILNYASDKLEKQRKENIILYVSSFYPHKNHLELIKAFENIYKIGIKNWKLVLVGKKTNYFYNEIKKYIDSLISKNNIFIPNYLTDKELYKIYSKAKIFVFPSRYEGFGIPILEAMYFKNLIIAKDLPVFKEIYEDSIFYYSNNLEKVLYNFILNYNKINMGKIYSKYNNILSKYTWDNSFQKLLEILDI